MQEFMLLVRNSVQHQANFKPEDQQEFLEQCRIYIEGLKAKGKLIAAQPIAKQGGYLSGEPGDWKLTAFPETPEVIVGYYHVRAESFDDAVEIAKGNPEFVFTKEARVEVRSIKTKEETTGFFYPKG